MAKLAYKTRGNSSPQNKERVYFCCHPKDFEGYFNSICEDIFKTQNCAIYYNEEAGTPWDKNTMEFELKQMKLFVVPVTTRFLYHSSDARDVELQFAAEHHIPVLPLMQEDGLDEGYQKVFGDLQYLDKNAAFKDPTALPYEQKLEKFLQSVLLGDELAAQVREAFDAYIFLSYRKKDRKYAQELMRLIHSNDFCRDIAIWYDEFLVPSEGFNQAIADALTKSDLFALAVTPNLLEPDNYVMTTEYKEARKKEKPILPAEMVQTDKAELSKNYDGIPTPIDAHNEPKLSEALLEQLRALAIKENDTDPKHLFFIGLAYLNGIDVEIDTDRGVALIEQAANSGLPEAMEKMSQLYQTGEGVKRNYETSAQWLEKLVEYWEARFAETGNEDDGNELLFALQNVGLAWKAIGQITLAQEAYEKMLSVAEYLVENFGGNFHLRNLSVSYEKLGDTCEAEGKLTEAKEWYEKCLTISEQLAEETKTEESRRDLSVNYDKLAGIYEVEEKLNEAKAWYEKALDICEQLAKETDTTRRHRDLAISYANLGDICKVEGNPVKAKEWYEKGLTIFEQLAEETGTVENRRDLAIIYEKIGSGFEAEMSIARAKEYYEKSLIIFEQLAQETGTIQSYRDLSNNYNNLGSIFEYDRNEVMARKWYEKDLAIREQLVQDTKTVKSYSDVAEIYFNLGRLIPFDLSRLKQAATIYKSLVEQCPDVVIYQQRLAMVQKKIRQLQ